MSTLFKTSPYEQMSAWQPLAAKMVRLLRRASSGCSPVVYQIRMMRLGLALGDPQAQKAAVVMVESALEDAAKIKDQPEEQRLSCVYARMSLHLSRQAESSVRPGNVDGV